MSILEKALRPAVNDVDSQKPHAAEVGKGTLTETLGEGLVSDYASPGRVGKTLADLAPSFGVSGVRDPVEQVAPHKMWNGVPWAAKKKEDAEPLRPAGASSKQGNTPAKKKSTDRTEDRKQVDEAKDDKAPRLARGSIAPAVDSDVPSLAKPNQGMQTHTLAVNQPPASVDARKGTSRKRNAPGEVEAEGELDEDPIDDATPQLAPMRDADGDKPKKRSSKPQTSNGGLPDALRAQFESSLGVDLGGVRIHTDAAAAAATSAVGARAYAQGQNIYFADNAYDPASADGKHLLAHEVAHTVQQASSGDTRVQRKAAGMTAVGDRFETEADRAADAMVTGRGFSIGEQSGIQIARQSSGERAFLEALAVLGAFPSQGMVNTQTRKVKAEFPKGAHELIYYPLYNFMMTRNGHIATARYFRGNVNTLFNKGWIGAACRRQALGIGEDNESVATQISEGKSPAKVALKRAVERKKEADAMDLAPQRANVKVLMRSLEKVAQSPFRSTAQFEGDYMRLQDVGKATLVEPLRKYVKIVLEKFADAVEKRDVKLFPQSLLRNIVGLIGKNGLEEAYGRARALIVRKAKGTTKELREPTAAAPASDMLEKALKTLENAAKIPNVGPAFKGLVEIVTNTVKTTKFTKDTDAGDIVGDLSGLTSGLLNTIVAIVQLAGADKERGLQAAEQLGVATKFLGYVGSAASAGKHLAQIYSATDARSRTDAIVGLLGCVPVIGDALTVSFTALRWLGETFNQIRVASRDVALKEFFFGNTPVAPQHVPALLKAKIRMIRDLPVDIASARRTFAYLDPNPSDPTSSCQDLFAGLDARREWARAARTLHDKYKVGAFTIDGGMDWTSKPGNRAIDQHRVEAANEMKRAAASFIERKMRELTQQTGATD